MSKILVIGSTNIDYSVKVKDIPVTGQTVLGEKIGLFLGGKGANQAYACGLLKGDATFLTSVGKEGLIDEMCETMTKEGINCKHINSSNEESGLAFICVNEKGNNSIVVLPGANDNLNTEYLKSKDKLFQEAEYILLQMEIPQEAVYYAIERGHELGKNIILNPAPAPSEISKDILSKITYLTPNETELCTLSKTSAKTEIEIYEAAKKLLAQGVDTLIVTLGKHGAMVAKKDTYKVYRPIDVEVIDTTAAGDTFNAAFVVALSEGKSEEQAVEFANVASSISVSRAGAMSSIPTRQEVHAMCESEKKADETENLNKENFAV